MANKYLSKNIIYLCLRLKVFVVNAVNTKRFDVMKLFSRFPPFMPIKAIYITLTDKSHVDDNTM